VQGFLGSAGIVLARAIAHELFPDERQFTRVVSYLVVTTGGCSLLGPLLAGGLVEAFGWRAPVMMLAVVSGLVTIAAIHGFRRKATPASRSADELKQWPGWRSLGALLRNPVFLGSTALLSFSMAPLFTLFGLSPMLLASGVGKAPLQVAMLVSTLSCGFMAGAFLGGLRAATLGILRIACASIAAGFAILSMMMLANGPSLQTIVPGGMVVALASGYLNPVSLALALQADSRLAGTASGWSSAISLALAGVGTQLATVVYGAGSAWLIAIGAIYSLLCWVSCKAATAGSRAALIEKVPWS
jgi:predicted MFS family arabinose efflux permease